MKITYNFVNGESVAVEVSEEVASICMELDRTEYNNDHKETRRHTTLDNGIGPQDWFASDEYDPLRVLEMEEESKRIREAFGMLTEKQKELVEKIFIEGMSISAYAKMIGIQQASVSHRIERIRKKLKNFL